MEVTLTLWMENILFVASNLAIGISMIVLSLMVKLPMWAIASTGFLIVFGHNLLSPINFEPGDAGYDMDNFARSHLISDGVLKIRASYPVLPG